MDFNSIRKAKSERLLQSFIQPELEKGGKRAVVGEVRLWGNEKWVKHEDGWVNVNEKSGKATLEHPGGKRSAAQQHHIDHHKSSMEKHGERSEKEEKVENPLVSEIQTNLSKVLDLATPFLEEKTKEYIESVLKEGKEEPTNLDIEYYKLGITIDLIKAFSKYIKPTDQVKVDSFKTTRNGSVSASLTVTRGEEKYKMETEAIIAGGYNIQDRHYRYISHTKLPASENKDSYQKLEERRNKLSKRKKLEYDLEIQSNWYKRDVDKFEKESSKTYEEVISEHPYITIDNTFDKMNNGGKANFNNSPDEFNAYMEKERKETWQRHQQAYKPERLRAIHSDYQKRISKLQSKIEEIIN